MKLSCLPLSIAALGLAACGEPVPDNHFANGIDGLSPAAEAVTTTAALPVRVGEYGLNFDACPWVGTTRHVGQGATLPVRAAPSDSGAGADDIAAGGRFFVCARSLDQKWYGIVYEEAGALAPRCGVSEPVSAGRAYGGPCRSGWVSSAFVKLIAGNDLPDPARQAPVEPVEPGPVPGT